MCVDSERIESAVFCLASIRRYGVAGLFALQCNFVGRKLLMGAFNNCQRRLSQRQESLLLANMLLDFRMRGIILLTSLERV